MRQLRPYVPLLLFFLPLALICCKLLFTPVPIPLTKHEQVRTGAAELIDTGWPWAFASHFRFRHTSPATIGLRYSSWPLLAADIAVMLVPITFAAWFLLAHYRRHGRWLNFSLRGMLVLVTLAAIIVGWWTYNTRAWSRDESAFERLKAVHAGRSDPVYRGPEWLRRFLSDEQLAPFYYAESFGVWPEESDVDPWPLLQQEFPNLRYVHSLGVNRRPKRAVDWSIFSRLESLRLHFKELDDQVLTGIDALSALKELDVGGSVAARDSTLNELGRLTSLEAIWLPIGANERNTTFLSVLQSVRELHTGDAEINDGFIDLLTTLPALEELDMLRSELTDAGLRRLLDFPKLKEIVLPENMKYTSETTSLAKQLRKQGSEVRFGRLGH
jgi:hypothetical protein